MLFSLSLSPFSLAQNKKKPQQQSEDDDIYVWKQQKKKQKENGELAAIEPNMCGDYSH